ncbi:MAG: hypothetical protein HFI15_06320 [Lachnospiraceae bacterium]|jgi:hypothetical protein|nr:hypothetical protein [Lachnospiraceae bacterium]
MVLREKMLPCQSREAMVTVLSYHNGIMDGYLQHPRLGEKEKVESLSQMILLLNSLLDMENCLDSPLPLVQPVCRSVKSIAVFCIQILFREHYTWQGRLIWQNGRQEYVFHSAIELIQLVDEILAE